MPSRISILFLHQKSSLQRCLAHLIPFLLTLIGLLEMLPAQAQSIVPATDGTGTIVTPNGLRLDIQGGQQSADGANLFHSFQQFGLSQGQIANFLSAPQIQNILGRVVGGDASVINGLIQITGSNANLFLINPAGILFGPAASLNVPGAFTATTAHQIGFGNTELAAIGSNNYATLLGAPTHFSFSAAQPGTIVNAGNLAVSAGQGLSLLGGTIVNTGQLSAPGGYITLTAVPGTQLVRLSQPGSLLNLEFQPVLTTTALPVTPPTLPQLLTGGNVGSATGLQVNPDGSVQLVRSEVTLPTQSGTTIVSGGVTVAGQTGGTMNLLGNQVGIVDARLSASGISNAGSVRIGGEYRGQGGLPTADRTTIDSRSVITADSLVNGNGGRVIVWADSTQFFGNISARGSSEAGNGGFIEVSGKSFLTYQGGVDVLAPSGTIGTVLLDPTTLTIVDSPNNTGSLDASLPSILTTTPNAGANTVSWGALSNIGGNLLLEATGDITIAAITGATPGVTAPGVATLSLFTPGSLTITSTGGTVRFAVPTNTIRTNGAPITITGASLSLGNLQTQPLPQDEIRSGNGNVRLTANTGDLTVGNIDTSASAQFPGNGGNIDLITNGATAGTIRTGNLTANGFGNATAPAFGGLITATSRAGAIEVGTLAATGDPTSTGVSGGTVVLTTTAIGSNIGFSSIDTRGLGTIGSGGNVRITAQGQIRGTAIAANSQGNTIITTGNPAGRIDIQHDGGSTNLAFSVGSAAITPISGNGTIGGLQSGTDALTTGGFSFLTSPFLSPQNRIQIVFTNNNPSLFSSITALTGATQDQPFSVTTNALGLSAADGNADTTTIQIGAIASGTLLRVNGLVAQAGTLVPEGAVLEFTPATGFSGLLSDAFTLQASDGISVSNGVPFSIQVTATPPPPPPPPPPPVLPEPLPQPPPSEPSPGSSATAVVPCALTSCNTLNPTPPQASLPELDSRVEAIPSLELTSTRQFETYLGLEPTAIQSLNDQQRLLREIEQATGVRPAFVYIGFLPVASSPAITNQVKQVDSLNETPKNAADSLELVVVTARGDTIRRRLANVTRQQVTAVAQRFHREVSDPRKTFTTTYLLPAQQLYQWFVAPLQAELQARGINNLVFILDTGLRSLPMAALHDGQSFLIEQYNIGLMPSVSLTDTRYRSIRGSQVLGIGISESVQGQPPLPAVFTEVYTLVNRLWSGRAAFNTTATLDNLVALRQQQTFGIIHLATHAQFQPGSLKESYIQLWDRRLQLDQMRQLEWDTPQTELLVLSACVTALGSIEAELGFAGLAVQTGIKTTIASLWYINDTATVALMLAFYDRLRTAPIKAEALRQAQLALIKKQVVLEGDRLKGPGLGNGIPLPPESTQVDDVQLSHPYYWSAFTLVGNPW